MTIVNTSIRAALRFYNERASISYPCPLSFRREMAALGLLSPIKQDTEGRVMVGGWPVARST